MPRELDALLERVRACRICRDAPGRRPLPHDPRPVLQAAETARIAICSQAPGTRAHRSGKPFTDPSGDRLRTWMAIDNDTFYDRSRIAIVPMGFCFPGLDAKGGDLPPRPECAPQWRASVLARLPNLELMLLVGGYAVKWHMSRYWQGPEAKLGLSETVAAWRRFAEVDGVTPDDRPIRLLPLPHPSWRNNGWLRDNPWFESDLLPDLRAAVADKLEPA